MEITDLLPDSAAGDDREADPAVLSVDQAGEVLDVLTTRTARGILQALYERPRPASEIATEVDTSLQNVEYHLDRLEAAGLVEPAGTRYSVKGTEMAVYAPAQTPLVLVAGDPDAEDDLAEAISDGATPATAEAPESPTRVG